MKKTTLILFFVLITCFLRGQSWQERINHPGEINFLEIKETFKNESYRLRSKSDKPVSTHYKRKVKQYKRWARYWESRILEDGSFIDPMHTYYELIEYKENHSFKSLEANWSFIGPKKTPEAKNPGYPGLGRINAIAFDPNDSNIIWVGAPSGGLWKSIDGGNSWSTSTDNLPNLGVSDIAINHIDKKIMYIATGDAHGQHSNSYGIMKSTDGGLTWNITGLNYQVTATRQTARLLMDKTNPNILLATTSVGIYRTVNGGQSWAVTTGTSNSSFISIVRKTNDSSVIFAGASDGEIYKSTDSGISFNSVYNGSNGRVELGVTAAKPNFVLAYFQDGTGVSSVDGGNSWNLQNMPKNEGQNIDTQGGYNMCIAIAPNNENLIVIGAMNYAYRSIDGGKTWHGYLDGYWTAGKPYFYVHSDHHVLKFQPGSNKILFSCNDGGLHKGDITTNNPWTDLSNGLCVTQYYGLGGTPQDENLIIAGSQDNDVNVWNGTKWIDANNNTDGVDCLIDYSNPKIMYAASMNGLLTRTDDGFATPELELQTPQEEAYFLWPIVMDPIVPTTLYGGWTEIHKSTDKGETWSKITDNQLNGLTWQFIAVAPSDSKVIYAGDRSNLFVTQNGGTSWKNITSDLPNNISRIVVDATHPEIAYVTQKGYSDGKKVYKTTNFGSSWMNISGTLPNVPVLCIVFQVGADRDLYIGTDIGVFHKNSKMSDWKAYSTNLPNTIVNDLEIYYATGKIRAATFGRGIWSSPLFITKSTALYDTFNDEDVKLNVFPNPTDGEFKIEIDENDSDVVVYNVVGGVVAQFYNVSEGVLDVDLNDVCRGLYFVTVKNSSISKTTKLIVK